MELRFLGTSSGAPTNERNVTGLALRDGRNWDLFDCGEATQHQILRTPLSLSKLSRIFISHLHGDHWFGIFGLLGSRSMAQATSPVTVYGPVGLQAMVEAVVAGSDTHLTYRLDFVEVGDGGGVVVDDDIATVTAIPLTHRVTSFAWLIDEHDRPRRLDVARASALGVAPGPDMATLKSGGSVTVADGATVHADEVLGPQRRGRRIVIAGDNSAPDALLERTGRLDLLVHEATFTEEVLAGMAHDYGHSTAARVATAATLHGVASLVLTHFSARVGPAGSDGGIDTVEAEARRHYDGALHLAADFDVVDIDTDGAVRPRPPS